MQYISGTVRGSGHTKMNMAPPSLGYLKSRGIVFWRRALERGNEDIFFNDLIESEEEASSN